MISDILSEALDCMEPYLAAKPGIYDAPEVAMIGALRGHMECVLKYLDTPPKMPPTPSPNNPRT